jgi:hypothetical protein
MYVRDEKCIQFSDRIPERKRLLGGPLHRWKIVLKLDLTSIIATLPAFAVTVKWFHVPVLAMLSYFNVIFGLCQ